MTLTNEAMLSVRMGLRILRSHRAITRTLVITLGMHCTTATEGITGNHGKVPLCWQIQKNICYKWSLEVSIRQNNTF